MQNILDKELYLSALREGLALHGGRVYASELPPVFSKSGLDIPHSRLRLVIGLGGGYSPRYFHGKYRCAELEEGGLLVVPPNCYLGSSVIPGGRHCQLIFWEQHIRYLYSENGETFWYHTSAPIRAEGLHVIQALSTLPSDRRFDPVRLGLTTALIELAIIEMEDDLQLVRGKAYHTYNKAFEFIIDNLSGELSRGRAARECGVTVSHLSRLFMQFGNMDFVNTVRKIRVERAEQLLTQTTLSIKEIAGLCGFKSDRHFIRIFKRFYELSPGRYRIGRR